MNNILVSVIVPMYNVGNYISKCIESILNQTYSNIEVILVDDGSPDELGKLADAYAVKDTRIKVIYKTNGGVSSARNNGIETATGNSFVLLIVMTTLLLQNDRISVNGIFRKDIK